MKNGENLSIMEKAIQIARVPLFEDLAIDDIAHLAAETVEAEYEAGETIGADYEAGQWFHILIEGVCELRARDTVLRRIEAPDTFGLHSMLDIEDMDDISIAVIERSRTLHVQKSVFDILLADYPQITRALLRNVLRSVLTLSKRLEEQQ